MIQEDIGLQSWVQAEWFRDGKPDEEGTARLTFQKNAKETNYTFSYIPEGGWKKGKHEVVLKVNDEIAARSKFTIAMTDKPESVAKVPSRKKMAPLLPMENRPVINPHAAFYSEEGLDDMRIKGSENCRRVLEGQSARNIVN